MNTEPTHRTSHLLAEVMVGSEEKGWKMSWSIELLWIHSFQQSKSLCTKLVRNQSTNLSGFHVFPPSSTFPSRPMARLVPARRVREGENAAAEPTRRVETASFMVMEGACWGIRVANGRACCDDDETMRQDENRRTVMSVWSWVEWVSPFDTFLLPVSCCFLVKKHEPQILPPWKLR